MIQLTERTTYRNHDGDPVHIAGRAGYEVNGIPVWWSIQGDHYLADGRKVTRLLSHKNFVYSEGYRRSIVQVDHDPAWWEGVKTN